MVPIMLSSSTSFGADKLPDKWLENDRVHLMRAVSWYQRCGESILRFVIVRCSTVLYWKWKSCKKSELFQKIWWLGYKIKRHLRHIDMRVVTTRSVYTKWVSVFTGLTILYYSAQFWNEQFCLFIFLYVYASLAKPFWNEIWNLFHIIDIYWSRKSL